MSVPAVHKLRLDEPARGRWSVTFRVLAAIVGGYALASLITVVLSLMLPWIGVGQAEAVLATTIVSFLIYAAIIMAVFHARSALQAWICLFIAALPCGLVIISSSLLGGF